MIPGVAFGVVALPGALLVVGAGYAGTFLCDDGFTGPERVLDDD